MSLNTTAEIIAALGSNYDADLSASLSIHLETAEAMLSTVESCATSKGITLAPMMLKSLERLLACHYYCLADRPLQEEVVGKSEQVVQGLTDMGFKSTYFGQSALQLDPSGCLNGLQQNARASFIWLGTED